MFLFSFVVCPCSIVPLLVTLCQLYHIYEATSTSPKRCWITPGRDEGQDHER